MPPGSTNPLVFMSMRTESLYWIVCKFLFFTTPMEMKKSTTMKNMPMILGVLTVAIPIHSDCTGRRINHFTSFNGLVYFGPVQTE